MSDYKNKLPKEFKKDLLDKVEVGDLCFMFNDVLDFRNLIDGFTVFDKAVTLGCCTGVYDNAFCSGDLIKTHAYPVVEKAYKPKEVTKKKYWMNLQLNVVINADGKTDEEAEEEAVRALFKHLNKADFITDYSFEDKEDVECVGTYKVVE